MTDQDFKTWYERINWSKGEYSTREWRKRVKDFWKGSGAAGADFLIESLFNAWHMDELDGVSNLLVDLRHVSVPKIVQALKRPMTDDQAEAFLTTLGWIGTFYPEYFDEPDDTEEVVAGYLSHPTLEVRDAACQATKILVASRAYSLVVNQKSLETDKWISEEIDDLLIELSLRLKLEEN